MSPASTCVLGTTSRCSVGGECSSDECGRRHGTLRLPTTSSFLRVQTSCNNGHYVNVLQKHPRRVENTAECSFILMQLWLSHPALDDAVGHAHLAAEGGKPDHQLYGVHVVRDHNERRLLLFDEGGHVLEAELDHLRETCRSRAHMSYMNRHLLMSTLLFALNYMSTRTAGIRPRKLQHMVWGGYSLHTSYSFNGGRLALYVLSQYSKRAVHQALLLIHTIGNLKDKFPDFHIRVEGATD